MTVTIRTFRDADVVGIVELMNAADAFDKTEEGTSEAETRAFLSLPNLLPEHNVFIAQDQDGRIVGYGNVRLEKGESNDFRTWFMLHPSSRAQGLEERMLRRLWDRARERFVEVDDGAVDFYCHASQEEHDRIAAFEAFGMREIRRFWHMVNPNLDGLIDAKFPEGITTRAYDKPADDVRMHEADTEVFRDHWGHSDQPLEVWEHYMSQPFVKPELSILAEDAGTGQVAGFCMIAVNDQENRRLGVVRGWIDILGVRRPYRRNGLGTALILQGLYNLRRARIEQAALGCDAENITGATRIYERVGFHVHKTRVAYVKRMRNE